MGKDLKVSETDVLAGDEYIDTDQEEIEYRERKRASRNMKKQEKKEHRGNNIKDATLQGHTLVIGKSNIQPRSMIPPTCKSFQVNNLSSMGSNNSPTLERDPELNKILENIQQLVSGFVDENREKYNMIKEIREEITKIPIRQERGNSRTNRKTLAPINGASSSHSIDDDYSIDDTEKTDSENGYTHSSASNSSQGDSWSGSQTGTSVSGSTSSHNSDQHSTESWD